MVKNFFKLDQTQHEASHEYPESKTIIIFGVACLDKKLGFHTEICEFRE